jgi:RNA polymerase sigma factor (sigma-70 family)
MSTIRTKRTQKTATLPGYLHHESFDDRKARQTYDPSEILDEEINYDSGYMPDEVTRDHAMKMHYAAFRMHKARSAKELTRWNQIYLTLRDRIVIGNKKLVFRAVRRRSSVAQRAEDMISDCQIVLIQAVAAFNPWLGIRFSTYAYTCLVRALSRLSQKMSSDWFARSLPLDMIADGEPRGRGPLTEPNGSLLIPIEEFLRDDHPLLSEREKQILTHRFSNDEEPQNQTLEKVGKALGLSKERVRQVQASALDKLRKALTAEI